MSKPIIRIGVQCKRGEHHAYEHEGTLLETVAAATTEGFKILTVHGTIDMRAWKNQATRRIPVADIVDAVITVKQICDRSVKLSWCTACDRPIDECPRDCRANPSLVKTKPVDVESLA